MGNVTGSVRMTKDEKTYLLKIVKKVLPSGADEWSRVSQIYMAGQKKIVEQENEAIRLETGTKGTKVAYERSGNSLKAAYRTLRTAKAPTGKLSYNSRCNERNLANNDTNKKNLLGNSTPTTLITDAKTIEDQIAIKGCLSQLHGHTDSEDEEKASRMHHGGSGFRSIDDLVEQSLTDSDKSEASPRAVGRTVPMPKKSKNTHQHMEDFNNHFGVLAEAIALSLRGENEPKPSVPTTRSEMTNVTDVNLEMIENRLGAVDNQFEEVNIRLDGVKNGLKSELNDVKKEFNELKETVNLINMLIRIIYINSI